MMDELYRRILIKNRVKLVDDLKSEDLMNHMIQGEIMIRDDSEMLNSKPTTKKKNEYFLDTLATRGPAAFDCFMKALNEIEDPLYIFLKGKVDEGHLLPQGANQHHTGRPYQVSLDITDARPSSLVSNPPQQVSSHNPADPSSLVVPVQNNPQRQEIDIPDAPSRTMQPIPSVQINRFPDRRIRELELNTFAGNMGAEWKSFIRDLGVRDNEIFHASSGCYTERDKIFACLVKWRNRQAQNATVRKFVEKCIDNHIDLDAFEFLSND